MSSDRATDRVPAGLRWLFEAPRGTSFDLAAVQELVAKAIEAAPEPATPEPGPGDGFTWRERLWLAPAETRIGVEELCEALGRPKSWVYRHTSEKAAKAADVAMLPFRRMDGSLVFIVGEIRAWVRDQETGDHQYRTEPAAWERGQLRRIS